MAVSRTWLDCGGAPDHVTSMRPGCLKRNSLMDVLTVRPAAELFNRRSSSIDAAVQSTQQFNRRSSSIDARRNGMHWTCRDALKRRGIRCAFSQTGFYWLRL
jgi:hypothetical protein